MFPIHRCSSPFLFFILYFVFYAVYSVLIAIIAITTIDPRLDLKFRGSRSKLSIVGWLETNPPPLPTIAPAAKEIQINLHRNIFLRPRKYTLNKKCFGHLPQCRSKKFAVITKQTISHHFERIIIIVLLMIATILRSFIVIQNVLWCVATADRGAAVCLRTSKQSSLMVMMRMMWTFIVVLTVLILGPRGPHLHLGPVHSQEKFMSLII